MFSQIPFLPQVKRKAIISKQHVIYELPHELPNGLRLRKGHKTLKTSWNYKLVPSFPHKIETLLILAKHC